MDMFLKILLAAFLGGIIGLEREISHKEAGLRTNILIAIGSTLITILSVKFAELGKGDPARLAAQIVAGIGFLGAGTIMQAKNAVHGLTTAATIWTNAAIGIAVGSGFYLVAFFATMLVVVVLNLFRYLTQLISKQNQHYLYIIATEDRSAILFEIKGILTELSVKYTGAKINKVNRNLEIEIAFHASETKNKDFIERVIQLKGVNEIVSELL